jgi:predicted small lipoprotein YifL
MHASVSGMVLLLCLVGIAGCASRGGVAQPPPDASTVATVRHTAGPQPQGTWVDWDTLAPQAHRSDGERALLLEVTQREGQVVAVEAAPLELANFVVRVEARSRRETVVALESAVDVGLDFDLYVSRDGERFRSIPVCSVAARGRSFERWPERAAWIAIAGVSAADGPRPGCE